MEGKRYASSATPTVRTLAVIVAPLSLFSLSGCRRISASPQTAKSGIVSSGTTKIDEGVRNLL